MTDVFTVSKRSEIMRKVKSSRNRSTELKLIVFFRENKIKGWRRNSKLFGKPDFVFRKIRTALFVDGCFWHGHNCRNIKPKNNEHYWTQKILRNKKRDKQVILTLKSKGWKVIRIKECKLNNLTSLKFRLSKSEV
jgi:DNA mismatch endonuclease (patch repair protein)